MRRLLVFVFKERINDGDHVYTFLVARTDAGGTNIRALFSHGSNNADGLYIRQTYSTGKWEAIYSKAADTAIASVTDSASSSRWHVLQLIRISDLAILYLDGVPGVPVDVSGYGIDGSRTLYLGWDGAGNRWAGDIAYARMDAVALSVNDLAGQREKLWAIASSLKTVPCEDVIIDGDMEAAGTAAWTDVNSAVLSKQTTNPHSGTQVLRIAYGGTPIPIAMQIVLTAGRIYRVVGWARGDGTWVPLVAYSALGTLAWSGTPSIEWQFVDSTFYATDTLFFLMSNASSAGYVEFDDVQVLEDAPYIANFTRTTSAYQTYSNGTMSLVGANIPRVGGDGGGILIERQAENICLQSQTFNVL